jgi:cytochrome c oxidase assembly protein subunit 15
MIHRYAATTLGLVVVLIAALAVVYRRRKIVSLGFATVLLCTVVFQGALGALTVWWLVKPLIVTLHLIGGLSTLSLLTWLWLTMRRRTALLRPTPGATHTRTLDSARRLALVGVVALGCQIALGGWTSSNYAAVACPDFPRCQNQWWPANMDYPNAFMLWRGLDVNYTGGVLEHPARVAIHFTHRLGAIVASLALLLAASVALRRAPTTLLRRGALLVYGALALQLCIGVFMVLRGFPLALATAHNAGAALLLIAALTLNRRLREE